MNTLIKGLISSLNKYPLTRKRTSARLLIINTFHNHQLLYQKNPKSEITPYHFNVEKKEKETFLQIINLYKKEDIARRLQLAFMKSALKSMDEFAVNKDLQVYKALMDVFPKGKYIPTNRFQAMMFHYLNHQNMAISILSKMEENFVIPDSELCRMVENTFGKNSLVMQKIYYMLYWQPKFARLNPWPVPQPVPTDPKELAQYAMTKMTRIDVQAETTEYRTRDVANAIDDTWVLSTMSRSQQELLAAQPVDKSLRVEGPFNVWIDKYFFEYFVLKGDPIEREVVYEDYDDISNMKIPFWEKHNFKIPVTIHEQEDGVCYATCITGTCSKDSLVSWIRCLQKTNPILEKIPVTFKIASKTSDTLSIEANENVSNVKDVVQSGTTLDK